MNDTTEIPAIPRIHEDAAEPAISHVSKPIPFPAAGKGGDGDPTAAAGREAAFHAEFAWHGKVLHPFSVSRGGLFAQLRVAMGAPDLARCIDDLDSFFADAARILWLCSHTPEDWAILRSSPAELQKAVDEWTDENVAGHEMPAVTLLGFQIYVASRKNEHEAAPHAPHATHGAELGN